jgi:hypothetical protein
MSGWNRLTNALREALTVLPIWTTEDDRRWALSYADRYLAGAREIVTVAREIVTAVREGREAPSNLGEIIAVARYEDAGWKPVGGFERWRRQRLPGFEQLDVTALVQWLGSIESDMQRKLHDLEKDLMVKCRQQEERVAEAQAAAAQAHQHLHAHHKKLILARLSVRDTAGAHEIARRVPAGSARNEIENLLHERNPLPAVADDLTGAAAMLNAQLCGQRGTENSGK